MSAEPLVRGDLRSRIDDMRDELAQFYVDLHRHPELSGQELRTSEKAAEQLRRYGFDVTTGIGGHGVVGILRNGAGPTVLLRADADALPVLEETGLPYASDAVGIDESGHEVPVMHACGHDIHVTCLVGAAQVLAEQIGEWSGTLLVVFQASEETGTGAQSMLDDGLFERFPCPTVVLGQQVVPRPAGTITVKPGVLMAAADSLRITMHGRGGHGSQPESTVDPILMAATTIVRLQGIVAREIAPADSAVVTVGAVHGGTKENVIPRDATLSINVRTFDDGVRERVLSSITRIAHAEATASGAPAPPTIASTGNFPLTVNDAEATERVTSALRDHLGHDKIGPMNPLSGSEDFGLLAAASGAASAFWFLGGTDPDIWAAADTAGTVHRDNPSNHSPQFAPVIHPTLETGVEALVVAALCWLTA
ncbi:amidohydrolase [Rhodococcus opacus]|nr:amidohydrolase [Rhodococcus opacus]